MTLYPRVLPRWSILRSLAKPFLISGVLVLWGLGILRLTHSRSAFISPSIPLAVFILSLGVPVALVIRQWLRLRPALLESELYLGLFMIAICLSLWFGTANYALYSINANSFNVDKPLEQGLAEKQNAWRNQLLNSARRIRSCEEVIRLLQKEQGEQLQLSKINHVLYKTTLKSSNLIIDYHLFPDWDQFPPSPDVTPAVVRDISATVGSEITVVPVHTSLHSVEDLRFLKYLQRPESGIAKMELLDLFGNDIEWESDAWLNPIQKAISRPIPLSVFMYQAVMDTVGASPRYFVPASFSARLLALVYAISKFIFFGMIVAVLLRQVSQPKSDESK